MINDEAPVAEPVEATTKTGHFDRLNDLHRAINH